MVPIEKIFIDNPKCRPGDLAGWNALFPYYAGFPLRFAQNIIASMGNLENKLIYDPWNGSGTTTFSAQQLGYYSCGGDINPAMVVVAKARLLSALEADALLKLGENISKSAKSFRIQENCDDALADWFLCDAATAVRRIERKIYSLVVGTETELTTVGGSRRFSPIAAALYVALFSVCRHLLKKQISTNPTWLKKPKNDEQKIQVEPVAIYGLYREQISLMATHLANSQSLGFSAPKPADVVVSSSLSRAWPRRKYDIVLTSPPYATRIDYAAATRLELAILQPLVAVDEYQLSKSMVGSVRVKNQNYIESELWGPSCHNFLRKVRCHPSKASATYYLKTHLDYFDKMFSSLQRIHSGLRDNGVVILVVQDSYYKDVHNDLPQILTEMASVVGLNLLRRVNFPNSRTKASMNVHVRRYRSEISSTEAVLCFGR